MEILSIGEKIKRARIYKGYTLKDLCDGKISVSKMSCIENNKIGLEQEVLDLIISKLEMDIDYLKESIEDQIKRNITTCDYKHGNEAYEKEMFYNLEVSESYEYYDLAFEILHKLFLYFLDFNFEDKLEDILARYYDLCMKSSSEENKLIYNMDMGIYLYENKEYIQAINYFETLRKRINNKNEYVEYINESLYKEAYCYLMIKNYSKAYELAMRILDYENKLTDHKKIAEVYHLIAVLRLRIKKKDYNEYEEKSELNNREDFVKKAENKFDYASIFFEMKENKKATEYIREAISFYPHKDKYMYAKFLLDCLEQLIENEEFEAADNFCEDSLNYAISLNNDELIERAYYYKSLILCKQNNFISAEMYINLSLDVLTKFGTRSEIYERYMNIGNLYSKCGAVSDSLKYFSLAIALEKKF